MRGKEILKYFTLALFLGSTNIAVKAHAINKNDSTEQGLEDLRKLYSTNKKIPAEFEKEILTTLSYYPELTNTRIEFCYASIFTSMKAVPTFRFLFQRKENRTYRIVMNKKTCCGKNLMQRLSPEALTGVIGHELGHVKDYSRLSNFGLLKLLIGYISKKGRVETEKRADQIAVEHNLGNELILFNESIMKDACTNPKYIQYKKKFYNSSTSLGNMIERKTVPATSF